MDFLDELIRTSKSGHTFDKDMSMLEDMLQDNIDRWGLGVVEVSVLSYVINKHNPKHTPKAPGKDQHIECPKCKAPMLEDEMKWGCGMCGYKQKTKGVKNVAR